MKIQIENRQSLYEIDKRKIRRAISGIFKILDCTNKEISVVFTDDETIKSLNHHYLGRNKPTNVISFSMQEGKYGNINPEIMGDVIISLETAQRDAARGNLTFQQEIDFLLIHGILHLLGYNHENTSRKKATEMHRKETEVFNQMNFHTKVLM